MASLHSEPSSWPPSLDEAVDRLLTLIGEDNRLRLRDMHPDSLIRLHFSLGMSIRESFGLWAGNSSLLESCGTPVPDDASMTIIREAWRRLQADAPDRSIPAPFTLRDPLALYLLRNYPHLLTSGERQLLDHEEWYEVGGPDDPGRLGLAILSAPAELQPRVARGRETIYREIVSRLLSEHAAEIVINRCPVCHAVCRTPKAQQCLECGHDWHNRRERPHDPVTR